MQRTASGAAFYLLRVCQAPVGYIALFSRLAVAKFVLVRRQ